MSALSLSAVRDRQARLLFAAQLLSQFGDKLMLIGMLWYLTRHGSASIVSWYLGLSALPHLLTMPVISRAIAKLGGELRTVIVADIARGVMLLAFASSMGRLHTPYVPFALFAISFVLNLFASLFNPAMLSLPTRLAGEDADRQRVTALLESCVPLSAVFAPLLATGLYAALGLIGLIALNAFSYLLAAALECQVTLVEIPAAVGEEAAVPAKPPFSPVVATMLGCFFAMNLFLGPVLAFLPLFAQNVFGGRLSALAAMESALGVGTLVGTLVLSVLSLSTGLRRRIAGSLLAVALCYLGFSFSRTEAHAVCAIALLGFFLSVANVAILGFFQARPSASEVIRLMAWVNMISVASLPLSMSLVGLVLARFDVRTVAQGCAAALVLVTVISAIAMAPKTESPVEGKVL